MSRPMCNMVRSRYALAVLLVLCPLALTRHDDDFAFDSEEIQLDLHSNHSEIRRNSLKRLWGVPDTSAYVGHLFRMEIPKEAFTGEVLAYKVRTEHGRRTPPWMAVDSKHGLVSGVPMSTDIGTHAFTVTAHGRTPGIVATDNFVIEVKKAEQKSQSKYGYCHSHQNKLVLMLLIDQPFGQIAPRNKIRALMELSQFMALDADEFWIDKIDKRSQHAVISSGPGTSNKRRGDSITAIYLNVGCGSTVWSRHRVLVAGLREQSRDGTLSHLLRLPLLGWRLVAVKPVPRLKRQLSALDEGSGGYEYDDGGGGDDDDDVNYSGYDDDDEYEDSAIDNNNPVPPLPAPTPTTPWPHPHRHHHGEIPPPSTDSQTDPATTATTATTARTTTVSTSTTAVPTTVDTTSTAVSTSTSTALTQSTAEVATALTQSTAEVSTALTQSTTEVSTALHTTPEPEITTNELTTEIKPSLDHKVNISPILVTESTNHEPVSVNPRRLGHSPVVIVPESSTEQDAQTVVIRASNEVSLPPSSSTQPTTRMTTEATTLETVTASSKRVPSSISWIWSTTPDPTEATTLPTVRTTLRSLPPVTLPTTTSEVPPTTTELVPTTTLTDESSQENTIPVSTEGSSTIIGRTTETVTFPMPINQPPTLKHHMKKLAITAGKAFRYIIPPDLFTDPEDGNNLSFSMYDTDNVVPTNDSWIQFLPKEREVYGLPLESHVSRWDYIIEAKDSDGATARAPLDITVQQHKSVRTLTHEFGIRFKLNKIYQRAIDWQIRVLEGLVTLFRDGDMNNLTVLNVTRNGDIYEFVWANDSLPRDDPTCPKEEVNRLMKVLESRGESGSPSSGLSRAMSPGVVVTTVWSAPRGVCVPPPPPAAAPAPLYPPVPRNQVDYIRATPGHLLVYTVPEDTFYDPEDGGTRNLHLSLRYNDRSPLLSSDWLQFDANNQEFYGLPIANDVGSKMYHLIAEDSSKKSAYDSLVVEVLKAPAIAPTVEFQMTLDHPIENTASVKRKVVEKLAALFGDKDTDSIRIQTITDNPTTIIWYNTSLPMDRCPKKEIEQLREVVTTDEHVNENVDQIFDKDFKVMSIRLIPLGLCAEQNTKTSGPSLTSPNVKGKTTGTAEANYSDYLVTFIIPIVFIVCMIVVASIIACVLYRRKRTGKMSVGDEEERQAFRSKGIPVIFQDELEEQAGSEPLHKSPVIMREEKPPLLPPAPSYRGVGPPPAPRDYPPGEFLPSAPYRPPPPVSNANPPPRPKATPNYRKPPPYVPP